jgi:hypothetical protein
MSNLVHSFIDVQQFKFYRDVGIFAAFFNLIYSKSRAKFMASNSRLIFEHYLLSTLLSCFLVVISTIEEHGSIIQNGNITEQNFEGNN